MDQIKTTSRRHQSHKPK